MKPSVKSWGFCFVVNRNMPAISDMFSFDTVADTDAQARRAQITEDTNNMISSMMKQAPTGGFMQGIEGEGLSPDAKARTYSETDDTRKFQQNEQLGTFKTPAPGSGSLDQGGFKLPMKTLDMPFIDREKLKGFPKPQGMSGGRMYQRGI